MARLIAISISVLLSGCQIFAGVAVHPENYDAPDVRLSRGVGFVMATQKLPGTDNLYLIGQHDSGLNTKERSPLGGLNKLGVMVEIK